MNEIIKALIIFLLFLGINCQCSKTNEDGQCIECIDGYFLSNFACYEGNVQYCLKYNYFCVKCLDGYILKNNECIKGNKENCNIYEEDSCSHCNDGYKLLVNGECILGNINNCKLYDGDDCKKCNDG